MTGLRDLVIIGGGAAGIEAAEQLPLGRADKLFLELHQAEDFPHDAHRIGNPRSAETGSYFIRPMGMPVVEGFFGGRGAGCLEKLQPSDAAAVAIDELAGLLGNKIRKRLSLIACSRWGSEEWIGGAYSHCPPRLRRRPAAPCKCRR